MQVESGGEEDATKSCGQLQFLFAFEARDVEPSKTDENQCTHGESQVCGEACTPTQILTLPCA
jgi:hypothetical protein